MHNSRQVSHNRPLDRRVRRTRKLLRDALMALMLEKGYADILVQDITDRADLSRATFYLHYKDKEELLAQSLEEMFDELVVTLKKPVNPQDPMENLLDVVVAFRHVQEYAHLYRVMLGESGLASVIHRIHAYLSAQGKQRLLLWLPPDFKSPVSLDLIGYHLGGSLYSLCVWWLEHGMPHTPEYMAEMYQRLAIPGVLMALGLSLPPALHHADGTD